jgi:hypothetical protein
LAKELLTHLGYLLTSKDIIFLLIAAIRTNFRAHPSRENRSIHNNESSFHYLHVFRAKFEDFFSFLSYFELYGNDCALDWWWICGIASDNYPHLSLQGIPKGNNFGVFLFSSRIEFGRSDALRPVLIPISIIVIVYGSDIWGHNNSVIFQVDGNSITFLVVIVDLIVIVKDKPTEISVIGVFWCIGRKILCFVEGG